MSAITMTAVVGDDHRIIVSVPEEIPPSLAQLIIHSLGDQPTILATTKHSQNYWSKRLPLTIPICTRSQF